MKRLFISMLPFLLISCSASISTSFTSQNKPLTIEDKVAFLDLINKVPEGAKKLGEAKYGDSGFSTSCDFNSILINARKSARANGANIVKVVKKSTLNVAKGPTVEDKEIMAPTKDKNYVISDVKYSLVLMAIIIIIY